MEETTFPVFVDEVNGLYLMGTKLEDGRLVFNNTKTVYLQSPYVVYRNDEGEEMIIPVSMASMGVSKDDTITVEIKEEW